jgi:hypothetical protein
MSEQRICSELSRQMMVKSGLCCVSTSWSHGSDSFHSLTGSEAAWDTSRDQKFRTDVIQSVLRRSFWEYSGSTVGLSE